MDRYLAEFRFTTPRGLSDWQTVERPTPLDMRDVVTLIADYHEAFTDNADNTAGLFRCAVLQHDTGTWRDVTGEALDAFGRWHLDARGGWPWFMDRPDWLEDAA